MDSDNEFDCLPYFEEENFDGKRISPFATTPHKIVDQFFAHVESKCGQNLSPELDRFVDLGCADGRLVVYAAKKYGLRSVGVDLDTALLQSARDLALKEDVSHLCEFASEDIQTFDLSPFTVTFAYLVPLALNLIKSNISKWLLDENRENGARRIFASYIYSLPNWTPSHVIEQSEGCPIYFYDQSSVPAPSKPKPTDSS